MKKVVQINGATSEQIATELRDLGVHVFYDHDEKVELWGKDLYRSRLDT